MSVPQGIKETLLWKKAVELVENIQSFSDRLPETEIDIYNISNKLKSSANELPHYIEDSYISSSKAFKGKNVYLAELSVIECINCLAQAKRLNLGEPSELIESANQFHKMLKGETVTYNHSA